MSMTVQKFRQEAMRRRRGRRRGAPRYTPEQREFAVAHGRAIRAAGGSVGRAAEELGISDMTLSSWLRVAASAGRLREVRLSAVVPEPRSATEAQDGAVVVTAASGDVVTGLSVQQAAELLRALR